MNTGDGGGDIREESERKIHNPGPTDISACDMHNNNTEWDFIKTGYMLVFVSIFNIFPEKLRISSFICISHGETCFFSKFPWPSSV